jgi:hypothetical protein
LARILSALLLSACSLAAFAADKAEAPVEKADPIVIVGFLVLFFGGCAGYLGWLLYTKNKAAKDAPVAEAKTDAT